MSTQAAIRPRALQTYIGFLPTGKCALVRYWEPIDAFLCGRCERCTARPVRLIDGSHKPQKICVRFVPHADIYAECFG